MPQELIHTSSPVPGIGADAPSDAPPPQQDKRQKTEGGATRQSDRLAEKREEQQQQQQQEGEEREREEEEEQMEERPAAAATKKGRGKAGKARAAGSRGASRIARNAHPNEKEGAEARGHGRATVRPQARSAQPAS